MQGILYPNEWRPDRIFYNILFGPYFQIYGELFLGERSAYPFEDHLADDDPDNFCNNGFSQDNFTGLQGDDPENQTGWKYYH